MKKGNKQTVFEKILDKSITNRELTSSINIDDYINYVDGLAVNKDKGRTKFTYGVNVRLSREIAENDIYPFNVYFPENEKEKEKPDENHTIPKFLKDLSLKEVVFKVEFVVESIKSIKVTQVSIQKGLNTTVNGQDNVWYSINPFAKRTVDEDESGLLAKIEYFFKESQSTFLHVNIHNLGIELWEFDPKQNNPYAYVWVCGVDPDVSEGSDGDFLTNILAISNNSSVLENFIEQKRSDIMEFVMLLKSRKTDDADSYGKKEARKSAKAAIMSRNMSHNLGSHVMAYLKQQLSGVTTIMKEENKVLDTLIPDTIKRNFKDYLKEVLESSRTNLNIATSKNQGQEYSISQKIHELLPILTTKVIEDFVKYCEQNSIIISNQDRQDYEKKIIDNFSAFLTRNWEPAKIENVEFPFLVGLGRFINYLQERQDYIATISTDYIPYGAPVNLKDAIYDELNPDLRYLRHKKEPGSDANNKPSNILLNYIAKSEGLSRENMNDDFSSENDIRIGYVDYSLGKPCFFGIDSQGCEDTNAFESSNLALTKMRKLNFSLPGGLVGRQAIFSIIENLIRNAAKHGDTSKVKNLDFMLDVIDGSDIVKQRRDEKNIPGWVNGLRIHDKKWRKLYEKSIDINDIYILTITDNLPSKSSIIENLKKGLDEDFIDSTNQMTTANKGIKEIRISAAWLRGETDENKYFKYDEVEQPGASFVKKAPLVAVELSADKHLRYIICVPKHKIVAIISKVRVKTKGKRYKYITFDKNTLKRFKELERQNSDRWNVLTDIELKKSKTSYNFILCPNDDEAFEALRPYTSNRLCRWIVNEESNNTLNLNEEDVTLNYIYKLFTGLDSSSSEDIYIDDERAMIANEKREETDKRYKVYNKIKFILPNENEKKEKIYLYRTHHSTENNYIAFYKYYEEYREKCIKHNLESYNINKDSDDPYGCVEGITGDNSSDRLIRREVLDERWYYTHLYSLKKRVAIIDERIFKMVHNIDENLFKGYDDEASISILELSKKVSFEEIKNIICDDILSDIDSIYKVDEAQTIDDIIKITGENLPQKYFKEYIKEALIDKTVYGHSHLSPYYKGKKVDIFTIAEDANGLMALYGCCKVEFDTQEEVFNNTFIKLATFKKANKKDFVLEPVSPETAMIFESCYDYISIHQGILDKVYENLGIKNDNGAKCRLTHCIHQRLMINKQKYGNYLPRLIIHSGRAKPTKNDMPQEQPFIQYAAIENAVKDCKSMLVELLDFAKFENN